MASGQQINWIWTKDWGQEDDSTPQLVLFRKQIKVEQDLQSAKFKITADSRYKLWVNGQLVEVGPLKGTANQWYFDIVNLKEYLHKGDNVIAVEVLRYPPISMKGNFGINRTQMPGLYVSGTLKYSDEEVQVNTDTSWCSFRNHQFQIVSEDDNFAPMQIYEQTAGDEKLAAWKGSRYDDSGWSGVRDYTDDELPDVLKDESIEERPVPFMYRIPRTFKEVKRVVRSSVTKNSWSDLLQGLNSIEVGPNQTEIVEISAGKEMTGYLNLKFLAGQGAHIRILQSESYVEGKSPSVNGLSLYFKEDREDSQNGYLVGFEDNYDVAGYGQEDTPESYQPFWFRTFRFIRLEIQTGDEPLTLAAMNYEETGYPLRVKTKVVTSDPSLSGIWKMSELTLQRCMHETYEDCPFYEQLQYVMDTRTQMLFTYTTSADDRLARQAIKDFAASQADNGLLNAAYPSYEANVIPTFSIYYIKMLEDHMMYFDDQNLLNQYFPTVRGILDYFDRHLAPEGYVATIGGLNGKSDHWSFIDWAPEWNQTTGVPTAVLQGPITIESLLYLYGLQSAEIIAKHLGQSNFAEEYSNKAENIQSAIRKYCVGDNGMIQDGPGVEEYSQHCQVFGILTHTLTEDQGRSNLQRTIDHKQDYAQCSVAMSFYLFRALEKVGLYQLSNDYWNIWREMLRKNSTTSVESSAAERSECHAWGAVALYEMPAVILGVQPASPGYEEIRIKPNPGYLKSAKGDVMTPKGNVHVEWRIVDGQMNLVYKAPGGVKVVD